MFFLAALGFHRCESFSLVGASRGYSSCSVWVSHCDGFFTLVGGSRMQAQELLYMGLVALRHVGSFWTRDRTACPLHWQADSQPLDHEGGCVLERACLFPCLTPSYAYEAKFLHACTAPCAVGELWYPPCPTSISRSAHFPI